MEEGEREGGVCQLCIANVFCSVADWVVQGEGSRLSGELYRGQKMHLQSTGLIVSRGQGRGWEINAQHHLNGAAGAFAWMRQSIHFRRGLLPSRSWRLLQAA